MTTQEKIDVLLAKENGKEIEFRRRKENGSWDRVNEPSWNFYTFEYRVAKPKPEPVYRPWTPDEVPVGATVLNPKTEILSLILGVYRTKDVISVAGYGLPNTAKDLLERFTMPDGSPCGVLQEPK